MNDLLPETVVMLRGLLDKYNAAPESYGPDSEKMRAWYRITPAAVNALPALLDAVEQLAEVREQVARGALCPMCSTGMSRRTVGMVCQICGTDYASPEYANHVETVHPEGECDR